MQADPRRFAIKIAPLHKASRTVAVALALMLPGGLASAQSREASADTLLERLRAAEEAIAMLQQQVAEQAAQATTSRSRARIELRGRVVVNGFSNSMTVNNVDNPQFVFPAPDDRDRGLGASARQTRLGIGIFAPSILGARFDGDVDIDFYGGQFASPGGRHFPVVRLRTAHGTLRWNNAELLVGQESPLIAAVDPLSVGGIGNPLFATAGNLWLWLPQLRATVERGEPVRIGFQGAVLAPNAGEAVFPFDTRFDVAELSRTPFLQGRIRVAWGEEGTVSEVGCGVHHGRLQLFQSFASRAFACSMQLLVLPQLELRGEGFTGQALRGLGGGGVAQSLAIREEPASTNAIRSRGGWAQLIVTPSTWLATSVGCGIDDPRDEDLAGLQAARLQNNVCAANAIVRPAAMVFAGLELRRMATRWPDVTARNTHVNLGIGFEF